MLAKNKVIDLCISKLVYDIVVLIDGARIPRTLISWFASAIKLNGTIWPIIWPTGTHRYTVPDVPWTFIYIFEKLDSKSSK